MKRNRKKIIFLLIIGMMAYGVPIFALCSSHCIAGNTDINSPKDADCSFSSYAFVPVDLNLTMLFILPTFAVLSAIDRFRIPRGFYLSPFRPPRLLV